MVKKLTEHADKRNNIIRAAERLLAVVPTKDRPALLALLALAKELLSGYEKKS